MKNSLQRVPELVDHPLLQRNDGVLCDRDELRTNLSATGGDIAVADVVLVFQVGDAVFRIERMHLKRGRVYQEPGADEFFVLLVFTQHMANVLAKEAPDAF